MEIVVINCDLKDFPGFIFAAYSLRATTVTPTGMSISFTYTKSFPWKVTTPSRSLNSRYLPGKGFTIGVYRKEPIAWCLYALSKNGVWQTLASGGEVWSICRKSLDNNLHGVRCE